MFLSRCILFLSVSSGLLIRDVIGSCNSQTPEQYRGNEIAYDQCLLVLKEFAVDKNGTLSKADNDMKKTCGNCKIHLTVSTSGYPKAEYTLKGLNIAVIKDSLDVFKSVCAFKGKVKDQILPSIGDIYRSNDGTGYTVTMELDHGDLPLGKCSNKHG